MWKPQWEQRSRHGQQVGKEARWWGWVEESQRSTVKHRARAWRMIWRLHGSPVEHQARQGEGTEGGEGQGCDWTEELM